MPVTRHFDVNETVDAIGNEQQRGDMKKLVALLKKATGEDPEVWEVFGGVVGFGEQKYKCGTWAPIAVGATKTGFSIHCYHHKLEDSTIVSRLGKLGKTGGGILRFKKLSDINQGVLVELVQANDYDPPNTVRTEEQSTGAAVMKKKNKSSQTKGLSSSSTKRSGSTTTKKKVAPPSTKARSFQPSKKNPKKAKAKKTNGVSTKAIHDSAKQSEKSPKKKTATRKHATTKPNAKRK